LLRKSGKDFKKKSTAIRLRVGEIRQLKGGRTQRGKLSVGRKGDERERDRGDSLPPLILGIAHINIPRSQKDLQELHGRVSAESRGRNLLCYPQS